LRQATPVGRFPARVALGDNPFVGHRVIVAVQDVKPARAADIPQLDSDRLTRAADPLADLRIGDSLLTPSRRLRELLGAPDAIALTAFPLPRERLNA
jgi:hypothetical protein